MGFGMDEDQMGLTSPQFRQPQLMPVQGPGGQWYQPNRFGQVSLMVTSQNEMSL